MEDDNDGLVRSPKEAAAVGSKRYFTGKPCKNGHVNYRLTSNRRCVDCLGAASKAWRESNVEYLQQYRRDHRAQNTEEYARRWDEWYSEHRDEVLDRKKQSYQENREDALAYAAKYRAENPGKVAEATAKWRAKNPDKIKEAWDAWYAEKGKEYHRKKRLNPKHRVDDAISGAIYGALKGEKGGRGWQEIVGYTLEDLSSHLEKLFQPGMTWENYGEWHIDHIIPKLVFQYESPEHIDFGRCWALSNLQPLWAVDNLKKGAKLTKPFQPSLMLAVNDNEKLITTTKPSRRQKHG